MNVGDSFSNIMLPETYLNINLNTIYSTSTGLSGVYAGEKYSNACYKFEVGISPGKSYSENRIDIINIEKGMSNHTSFSYTPAYGTGIYDYQGDLTPSQTASITYTSAVVGEYNLYLNTTSVSGSPSGNLVKAGDWIRNGSYWTQVSEDVVYSSNSSVAIPVTRPNLSTGSDLEFGAPTFNVKFAEFNPYTIQPYDRLQYKNASIKLIEVI